MRPAGQRVYDLWVHERMAFERRGPGPGGMNLDLRLRFRIARLDRSLPSGGTETTLTFEAVEAQALGPGGAAAARAARALEGAKAVFEVDARGGVQRFAVEAAPSVASAVEILASAFHKMAPTLSEGAKGPGARWGETSDLPLGTKDGVPLSASVTANYVVQGTGLWGNERCLLVDVELQTGARAAAPGEPPGALRASGSGRGQLCLDPQRGVLRAGDLDLTLRTGFALQQAQPSRQPLHVEQTLRLRLGAREAGPG